MLPFVLRRLALSVPLCLGISIIIFFLAHSLPGGPLAMYMNTSTITAGQLRQVSAQLGLDRPLYLQYLDWLSRALHGDFGRSFSDGRPALAVIWDRIPATAELMVSAFAISVFLAIGLGVLSALQYRKLADRVVTMLSYAGISMPVFWLGIVAILLFGVQLRLLPIAGIGTPGQPFSVLDNVRHLALPALVLAAYTAAQQCRYVRSSVLDVLGAPFVQTARSKGLSERVVILKHVLRNALIPVVTVFALDAAHLLSGALITETVFAWPGMGRLFYDSLHAGDYPVVIGIALMASVMVILFNLLADVLYVVIDRRVQIAWA